MQLAYLRAKSIIFTHIAEHLKIVCEDCGKSFKQKTTYRLHILKEHSDLKEQEANMLQCQHPGCDFTTLFRNSLGKHFKRVHLNEKNYLCTHCPKSFFNRHQLDEHTNGVHLNKKPYKCDLCDFSTAYNSKLPEHKRVAHGTQKYDCPYCNHAARYKGNLDKHINNVHKNLLDTQNVSI